MDYLVWVAHNNKFPRYFNGGSIKFVGYSQVNKLGDILLEYRDNMQDVCINISGEINKYNKQQNSDL